MIGDNYRQISPFDRWVFDASGNLAGASASNRSDKEARFLTAEQAAAVQYSTSGLTWANARANIASLPLWTPILITDVGVAGKSYWYSDATNLRPLNGYVSLWRRMSSIASPLATLTGSGAVQSFTLPDATSFPAGMLVPGISRVWAMAKVRRLGNSGASGSAVSRLGSGASAGINDNAISSQTISATVNYDAFLDGFADIISTTSYCSFGHIPRNSTATSSYQDRTTNFDCSGSNTSLVSIGINASVTVDQVALYGYEIGIYG